MKNRTATHALVAATAGALIASVPLPSSADPLAGESAGQSRTPARTQRHPEDPRQPKRARLSGTDALLTDADPRQAQLAQCQPVDGEKVEIVDTQSEAGGIPGSYAVRVQVAEGHCEGLQGWVDIARLEPVE
jgi:hypothetical protein